MVPYGVEIMHNVAFRGNFRFGIWDLGFIVSLCSIVFYSIDPPEADLKS